MGILMLLVLHYRFGNGEKKGKKSSMMLQHSIQIRPSEETGDFVN